MRTARLGDHATFLSGFAFKSKFFNDAGRGLPVVRIRDVARGRSETFYEGEYDARYLVSRGDYLIGMDGEFNLAPWRSDEALLNQRVCKLDSLSEALDRGYVARFLPRALKEIEAATPFVTVRHLSVKKLREIKIPLPPLAEQKRIAGILDAADALRAKRRESIEQLETLLQSTFLDMFADPVTNPMGWEVRQLGELLSAIDSGWSPKCLDRPAVNDEWGVLKLGAVTWCSFDQREQKALPADLVAKPEKEVLPGDLLFARKNTRELVAAAAYVFRVRPKLMLSDLIFRLRLREDSEVLPLYLWKLVVEPHQRRVIQQLAGGAAGSMPNISKAKLKTVSLIVPPLDLQRRFSTIVESVEAQKTRLRTHLAELDTLFASLQSRAFQGEL